MLEGGCHCGAVRYRMTEEVVYSAFCHCEDCRRCAGAPVVGWAAVKRDQIEIQGETTDYQSSENGTRSFCGRCGTGLFYVNEVVLPGLIDVQIATLDEPERLPPQIHVQVADRIGWMETADQLPRFERYPG